MGVQFSYVDPNAITDAPIFRIPEAVAELPGTAAKAVGLFGSGSKGGSEVAKAEAATPSFADIVMAKAAEFLAGPKLEAMAVPPAGAGMAQHISGAEYGELTPTSFSVAGGRQSVLQV